MTKPLSPARFAFAAFAIALASSPAARASEGPDATLALDAPELRVSPGFHRIRVELSPGTLASIAIFGERDALSHFAIDGVVANDPLSEDELLPRVVSFETATPTVEIGLEVKSDVVVSRVLVTIDREVPKTGDFARLVGMPSPAERDDGYLLERPNRYQFARPDVAMALIDAFRDTRHRYRRDPIGIADISQWDGRRPALDLGNPRHISHEGGRDVDIALPSTIEPSTLRDHCDKDISSDYTTAACRKGTSRALDALRLAYLLGRLVRTNAVDRIFLDREFIEPTAEAARRLAATFALPTHVADRLQPGAGVLRHSAWHTDHVHVRFLGEKGVSPFGEGDAAKVAADER